jgi:hypothetical protein
LYEVTTLETAFLRQSSFNELKLSNSSGRQFVSTLLRRLVQCLVRQLDDNVKGVCCLSTSSVYCSVAMVSKKENIAVSFVFMRNTMQQYTDVLNVRN